MLGRLVGAEQRVETERPSVAILIDVMEVLSQSDGPSIGPGELAVDQEFIEPLIDGELEAALPVGARVVGFLYHADTLPDGWGFGLEGLWIECASEAGPSLGGDIIRSAGWDEIQTFDELVEAIRDVAETPAGG